MPTLTQLREVQALAQAGLTYTRDPYDRQRYERLMELAADFLAEMMTEPAATVHRVLRAEAGYLTPKVDVRAVILNAASEVLLTRERADGLWSLPGGWADPGESPREIAVREVLEETGLRVRSLRLLAVMDKSKHPHPPELWMAYKLFIQCEPLDPACEEPDHKDNLETLESRWFSLSALPALSLSRNLPEQVRLVVHLAQHPDLPVHLD